MRIDVIRTLHPAAEQVRELAAAAGAVDGVDALSEQTLLHLSAAEGDFRHVVAVTAGRVVGYAHLDHLAPDASSEIVVAPDRRRQGIASAMWQAVQGRNPGVRVWAHGDLPSAQAWTRHMGLVCVRELRRLARPLDGLDGLRPDVPAGYTVRTFTPADLDAWVTVNGRAFADHPEQGRITADDVRARMREDWFDPAGFFLVDGPDGDLAAFHWTKTVGDVGEVYVVGVDPAHQGRGLGAAATLVGLQHLARAGLPTVTLYVDGGNRAALATYDRLGFARVGLDVMYGPDDMGAATRTSGP